MVSRVDEMPVEWLSPSAGDNGGAAAFLTQLACRVTPPGARPRLLELAVTPGQVSFALSANGLDVSSADPRRCAAGQIPGLKGQFDVVFAIQDELSRITGQREQVRCLRRVSSFLRPGGALVVHASVPDLARWDEERLDHEPAGQRLRTTCALTGDPVLLRYVWPAELDLMCELAELALEDRWGGWRAEPFTGKATHMSVFRN
ncbi:hypothetical protein JOF56_007523 [Kibdelosporangium banguiense]|uniref:Class I SAM-dependent methyltransferase n=1 Tax=Kibdelosporangium banguiense TaxID=1365924 RepID=A0ABS4TRV3_9PSEU|nr:hypothetical protein [Kibdelosporangium banguiense]MBP2327138.1 hypothetical protein [Kibdelosporangium banguiense]